MWAKAVSTLRGWKSRDSKLDENLVDQIIESQGLKQISDSGELEKLIDEVYRRQFEIRRRIQGWQRESLQCPRGPSDEGCQRQGQPRASE